MVSGTPVSQPAGNIPGLNPGPGQKISGRRRAGLKFQGLAKGAPGVDANPAIRQGHESFAQQAPQDRITRLDGYGLPKRLGSTVTIAGSLARQGQIAK
jgi:hypothetical protein